MSLAYNHRAALGCWINDMRNEAVYLERWPASVLDDRTVKGIVGCLELASQAGFNEFSVFGLLITYAWPPDIATAVDDVRRRQVNKVLQAAHNRGLKVLYGLGVYSWGFDRIIAGDPEVRGSNPQAMCGSRAKSWQWMQNVVDYILTEFDFDGFHLEASDQGRCTCSSCAQKGDVEYYSELNERTAEYIRNRWPDKVLMVNLCGYLGHGTGRVVAVEELGYLVELGQHLDFLIDPGHLGFYVEEGSRPDLLRRLQCDFGTSGGTWVYPPQRWNRLNWFLPHTMRTGRHIKQLYAEGGRAMEYYMGPVINPGVELNIAFGGRQLSDVGKGSRDILAEVIETLYRPRNVKARDALVRIVQRAEQAYFENWSPQPPPPTESPGELHIAPLLGATPGTAAYLTELWGWPVMNSIGRAAYRRELITILGELTRIEDGFSDGGRLERIKVCINNGIADIDKLDSVG